eukprot:916620-Ditylum_brightwellii.AAC.1
MKGMYGLKQATILAYPQLKEHLEQHGYSPIPCSNGLWCHNIRQTIFALSNYCRFTLDWYYKKNFVDALMPDFVPKALQNFQHETPKQPQYALHAWNKPAYGQKVQYAAPPNTSACLDKSATCNIQSIVRMFLYYGYAIDNTILPTLNEISTDQAKPTITMLMDCLA